MPSFDIVSKVDKHELENAVDQANREIKSRFDFKGVDASFDLEGGDKINLKAPSDFQIKQMDDILRGKLVKRDIDVRSLDPQPIEKNLSEARQTINVVQGIPADKAKKITKMIKDKKLKVQPSIQGEQVRVTGKKRDDLQEVMSFLRESELELALQFENFRD